MMSGHNVTIVLGDEADELSQTPLARAQGLYLAYMERLSTVTGDREAIAVVREELRADEVFWELSEQIEEITSGKMDWINAIMRVESKRAKRQYAGKMEEIRQERLRKAEEAKRAEAAELEALPNYGMF
jgi:hypothetical protein